MKSTQIKISNSKYKHANILKKITEVAGPFVCDIWLICGTNIGNAKSLVNMMTFFGSIKLPAKIEIRAENWNDESDAVDAIAKIFNI